MSEAHLVAAARGAGVMLGLSARPATAAEHAARLGCGPRRLGWLLDLLVADGALACDGERYVPANASDAGDAPGARLIARAIARDAPLELVDVAGDLDAARLACHDTITRVPARLVERIAARVGDGVLLDLGCGDGALAAAVLAAAPRCRARLVDRDVRHVAALRGPRVEIVAGDVEAVTGRARVVLLSNVLHVLPPGRGAHVVRHALELVEPGGALVIREVALDSDRRGPRSGVAFGLSLLLHGDAELPTGDELHGWVGDGAQTERVAEAIVIAATR